MIYLEKQLLESCGLRMTITDDGVAIEATSEVPPATIEIGKEFAARIGLDESASWQMIDDAISAALWCCVKDACHGSRDYRPPLNKKKSKTASDRNTSR